jgi:hypothetical protein
MRFAFRAEGQIANLFALEKHFAGVLLAIYEMSNDRSDVVHIGDTC